VGTLKSVNVAVLGCGVWGRNHARVYKQLPQANLVKICDIDPKTVKNIADTYQTQHTTNPDTIFNDPTIDAVSICTPTVTHADLAQRALEAGKHVLVEKPMTDTVQEAKDLIQTANKNNLHLAVGFVERFNPAVNEALNLVNQGEIGQAPTNRRRRSHQGSRYP